MLRIVAPRLLLALAAIGATGCSPPSDAATRLAGDLKAGAERLGTDSGAAVPGHRYA